MNHFSQPYRSHSQGRCSLRTYLPRTRDPLTQGNGLYLTSSSLKGEEDLTGELFPSTLAFSLEGAGVVLYEATFPALETSNAR